MACTRIWPGHRCMTEFVPRSSRVATPPKATQASHAPYAVRVEPRSHRQGGAVARAPSPRPRPHRIKARYAGTASRGPPPLRAARSGSLPCACARDTRPDGAPCVRGRSRRRGRVLACCACLWGCGSWPTITAHA